MFLMPLDFFAAFGPLEIQFGVVKLNVRADQIGGYVSQSRLRGELPIDRVLVHRAGKASQAGIVGRVVGL